MSGALHSAYYGDYGGRYVAEALWTPLERVSELFGEVCEDPDFMTEYRSFLQQRLGRPTGVAELSRLSEVHGGGRLWIKREDQGLYDSFCTTLAAGYGLLARRAGCGQLVGDTSNGAFGLALAGVGNILDLDVIVFISRADSRTNSVAFDKMQRLGAQIEIVDESARGRDYAFAESMRCWASRADEAFLCPSGAAAPAPYPSITEYLLSPIGNELERQFRRRDGLPHFVIAPVGTGGFAAGLFSPFVRSEDVTLIGVEAGGAASSLRSYASTLSGRKGVYQGTLSSVLQDEDGQIETSSSIANGLAVPVVGPQHPHWKESGLVHYVSINDEEVRAIRSRLAETEGLLPSLESAHALAYALKLLPTLRSHQEVVVGLSGAAMRFEIAELGAEEVI